MKAACITAFSQTLENLRVETVLDPIVTPAEAKILSAICLLIREMEIYASMV